MRGKSMTCRQGFNDLAVYDRRVEDHEKKGGAVSAIRRLAAHQSGRAIARERRRLQEESASDVQAST